MVIIRRFWCKEGFDYEPHEVHQFLQKIAEAENSKLTALDLAARGTMKLYNHKGHNIDPVTACGINQLLYSSKHACNLVLRTYQQSLQKKKQ